MTSFVLKLIALVTMFCDHFGDAFVGHYSFFNIIGRIAFPIFAFQISEGYIHTKNLKKYIIRLFGFALISQIPFHLFLKDFLPSSVGNLNIFFTLLLGLLSMIVFDYFSNAKHKILEKKIFKLKIGPIIGILAVLLISYIGNLLNVDYGYWGVLVIFAFYLFKQNKLMMIMSFICLCIIRYAFDIVSYSVSSQYLCLQYIYLMFATMFPIIFISLYNGKQGPKIKYLLYLFYPIHLALLYLIF